MRSSTAGRTIAPSTLPIHTHKQTGVSGKLTSNEADVLVPETPAFDGEPRDLDDPAGANLQPTGDEKQALHEPQGEALAEVTSSDDADPPIMSIDSEERGQVFTPESAPGPDETAPLLAVDKVTHNAPPKRMQGQRHDTPDNSPFVDEASLSLANTAPERKQAVPGTPIGVEPAVTQAELKEARDAVTQGRAELNMQQKALKLETRASLFMAGMQAFVDKLARKYGLKDHAVLALKQMFAHAEQKLQHRIEQRMQRVEQASTTLEDHTRQATYLSSLARGEQPGNAKEKPVQTHPPQAGSASNGAQTQGLDDVLALIDDTERALVKKAGQFGQEVISNDAGWYDDISQGEADGYLARLARLNRELDELENTMKQNVSPSDEVAPLETSAKANPKLPSETKPGEFVAFAQQQITDRPTRVR